MQARVVVEPLMWKVEEKGYKPENNIYFETNFTLGNGYMGVRGCVEEGFDKEMETYPGTYIAGIYDNFNGEYVELVNCIDLFAAKVQIGDSFVNATQGTVSDYVRSLDMREGTLTRQFTWTDAKGNSTKIYWQRFLSMENVHLACQRFRATPLNHELPIIVHTGLFAEVYNRKQQDYPPLKVIIPNYHLDLISASLHGEKSACIITETKTTKLGIAQCALFNELQEGKFLQKVTQNGVSQTISFSAKNGETVGFDKMIVTYTSRDGSEYFHSMKVDIEKVASKDYKHHLEEHKAIWEKRWEDADIVVDGDISAQQGIRFNIFQLIQANAYWDAGVSLPAKLLSHTRYKGNAFWDTETFMFPFFLHTYPEAAKNLLLYRYNLLPGAREKAKKYWMRGAMYPWCSAHDGSEQCDSWEYGDCEIHITADIAYAFEQYLKATGDEEFFKKYAVEVYIETARFWTDRVTWNEDLQRYTIIAVKGPDEYCAITNNNMYTNYMAVYNLRLAKQAVEEMAEKYPNSWQELSNRIGWQQDEAEKWNKIANNMFQNWDKKNPELMIQDDTFLMQPEEDLFKLADRKKPVLEILGYERVMRVRILRQTDVLMLMYLLNDDFTKTQKKTAFDYYEPITTHDSSLSYNTHCIMAAELGMQHKAVDYFYKTCRLDLDDEQDTARSGLHGASMGGTWMSVVNGFGGVRMSEGKLLICPMLPPAWNKLKFRLQYMGRTLEVEVIKDHTQVTLLRGEPISVWLNNQEIKLS